MCTDNMGKLYRWLMGIFLGLSSMGGATVTFEHLPQIAGSRGGADHFCFGDVDGDDDLDLIAGESGGDRLTWYANEGTGTFGSAQVISLGMAAFSSVDCADLDLDGDPDLVVGNSGRVVWFENLDGRGSFSEERIVVDGVEEVHGVTLVDLENDGMPDLMVATQLGIVWYPSGGGGIFVERRVIGRDELVTDVEIADVDGDKDLDIVTTGSRFALYLNENGFRRSYRRTTIRADYTGDLEVADVDRDGDPDLLVLAEGASSEEWTVFANLDGLGTFDQEGASPFFSGDGIQGVTGREVDGDGHRDLLVTGWSGTAWVGYIPGGGPQEGELVRLHTGLSSLPETFTMADLDGDGDADPVFSLEGQRLGQWLENADGKLTIGNVHDLPVVTRPFDLQMASDVSSADLDGDGDLDLLAAAEGGLSRWYPNLDGRGLFGPPRTIGGRNSTRVLPVDIDGDGDLDVISLSVPDGNLWWHENWSGRGQFRTHNIARNVATSRFVDVGDVNHDGKIDIICRGGDGQLGWYEQSASGAFGEFHVIDQDTTSPIDGVVKDFDGDGFPDMMVCFGSEAPYRIYRSKIGGGGFRSPQRAFTRASNLILADLDDDGDSDMVLARVDHDPARHSISWIEDSRGNGLFRGGGVLAHQTDVRSLEAKDLDLDGDLDLLVAYGDRVGWLEQMAPGEFGPMQPITGTTEDVRMAHAADFDGDGDLDVVSASSGDHQIAWYRAELHRSAKISVSVKEGKGARFDVELDRPVAFDIEIPFEAPGAAAYGLSEGILTIPAQTASTQILIEVDDIDRIPNHHMVVPVRFGDVVTTDGLPFPVSLPEGVMMTIRDNDWIVSQGSLRRWSEQFELTRITALLLDEDGDSLSRLHEYAFNLSPLVKERDPIYDPEAPVPAGGPSGGPRITLAEKEGQRMRIEFVRRRADSNPATHYIPEAASGPEGWEDLTAYQEVTPIDETWEKVVVYDPVSVQDRADRVVRVRVFFQLLAEPDFPE